VTISVNDEDDPSAEVVDAAWAKNDTRAQRGTDDGTGGAAAGAAVTGAWPAGPGAWANAGKLAAMRPAASATMGIRCRALIVDS
jgi:hypothetical protein